MNAFQGTARNGQIVLDNPVELREGTRVAVLPIGVRQPAVCSFSGIKMVFGPEASVASVGAKTFEEDSALASAATELAAKLREAVIGHSASQPG